jgi:hypothetical protein
MRLIVVLLVAAVHISVAVALYAARVKHGFGAGDLAVFALPALLAAIGYYFALVGRHTPPRVGRFAAAFGLALLSFYASMLINLNVYGS